MNLGYPRVNVLHTPPRVADEERYFDTADDLQMVEKIGGAIARMRRTDPLQAEILVDKYQAHPGGVLWINQYWLKKFGFSSKQRGYEELKKAREMASTLIRYGMV